MGRKKFRAWDTVKKEWIENFCISPEGIILEGFANIENPNAKLVSFVGLKDKNNKEIYEGDIVKTSSGLCNEVVFEDGAFWIESKICGVLVCDSYESELEVIGNIYENPELLGESEEK